MGRIVITANSYSPWEGDKRKHTICGAMIGAIGFAVAINAGMGLPLSWASGLGLAGLAGLAKEAWDYLKGSGTAEVMDLAWTVIGGCAFPLAYTLTTGRG